MRPIVTRVGNPAPKKHSPGEFRHTSTFDCSPTTPHAQRNGSLRERVRTGGVTALELVSMDVKELATEEQQLERKETQVRGGVC